MGLGGLSFGVLKFKPSCRESASLGFKLLYEKNTPYFYFEHKITIFFSSIPLYMRVFGVAK